MFIHAAAGCSTHIYTLIFYHKLSFTCHPYNQSEPCVNWNRASVNRHGWGAKKRHACHSFNWGVFFFLCHFCVFLKKKWYTFVIMCVKKNIYIYTKYVQNTCTYKRIPIFLAPSKRHRYSHCRNNYNHKGRSNICSDVIFWLLFLRVYYIRKKTHTQNL